MISFLKYIEVYIKCYPRTGFTVPMVICDFHIIPEWFSGLLLPRIRFFHFSFQKFFCFVCLLFSFHSCRCRSTHEKVYVCCRPHWISSKTKSIFLDINFNSEMFRIAQSIRQLIQLIWSIFWWYFILEEFNI